jgi:hypothetical protein
MLSKQQVGVLRRIATGERCFNPEVRAEETKQTFLEPFQSTAEEIVELGEQALLDGVAPHRETSTGHGYIDLIMVKGLTAKGRRALDEAKRIERMVALKVIYDQVGDSITEAIPVERFAAELELSIEEAHGLLDYFNDKGQLGDANQVGLSHAGIVEAERIISEERDALRAYGAWAREDEIKVQEREALRFKTLRRLYELSRGDAHRAVTFDNLQKAAGIDEDQWWAIFDYLTREGLMREAHSGAVAITARGVDEMERAEHRPDKATEHFSTQVTQHFHGAVGAVQTGSHSTAHVTQNIGAEIADVLKLLGEVRQGFQSLPPEPRQEAVEVVDALEEEIKSPAPRKGRVRAYLGQIGSFAKDTAVGVTVEVVKSELKQRFGFDM